ncbi:ABC1 kinase family protein [Saccharothrix stipae]
MADMADADRAPGGISRTEAVGRVGRIGWTVLSGVVRAAVRRGTMRITGRGAGLGTWSDEFAVVVERLGPAFIKFAQIASTRADVLPPGVCRALTRLHDAVAPMPRREVEIALARTFGVDWRSTLTGFDPDPVGSGSIACVYRARLADGRVVAVKVRRPDLEATVRQDVAILQALFDRLGRLRPLRGVPLSDMARSIGTAVLGQLDLDDESANMGALRRDLAALDFVHVPEPVSALCRETCVVMTFAEGVRDRVEVTELPPDRRQVLADQVLRAVFEMLFRTGLVHCDLHPGNLRLTRAGSIVVLDAGFVYRVSEKVRTHLALFFLNLGFRHGENCAKAVLASAEHVGKSAATEAFTADMVRLVDRFGGATARDFDLIEFATELFASQRRHGIYAASEFVFPLLALLMVEETVRRLDPDIDFQAIARPIVFRAAQAGTAAGGVGSKFELFATSS